MLCLITLGAIDAVAKDSFAFKEKVDGKWAATGSGTFSIKATLSAAVADHFDPGALDSNTLVVVNFSGPNGFGSLITTNTLGEDPSYVDGAKKAAFPATYQYWNNSLNQWETKERGIITITMSTRGVKVAVVGRSNGSERPPVLGGVHEFDTYSSTYYYDATANISVGDLSREMTIAITDKVKVKPEGVDPWVYQVIYKVSIKGKLIFVGP
jgi:hypothetical protein